MNKWINNNNFSFYDNVSTLKISTFKNIVIFDLDNTIIKTKSGKTFPINSDDWVFNYPNIPDVINSFDKTLIGIISNQKGLKTDIQIKDWQSKLNNMMKRINVHFVFSSFKDDRFRKPMIGSWEYLKDILKGLDVPNNNILYVGDAAGRTGDHTDTDLKFAQNCNFKFSTPEKFFKIKVPKQNLTISYPNLDYYTKIDFTKIITSITNNFDNKKILITMIGFPGCGKSYLRKLFINKFNKFKYNNKDDIKNKVISDNLVIKHNKDIDFIIDDNTNTNLKSRNELNKFYPNHYKIGIYFNYDLELAMHLNYMRMFWYGTELIKKVAYYALNKNFDIPSEKEFDYFVELNKLIPDFNLETNIKYYF
jgi:bifunctional polynucleotide phosphatase/kinase